MTYDQFEEHVFEAISTHISKDVTIEPYDQQWEIRNAARTLAKALRIEGLPVPHPDED